ncbi:MAG: hypothetical protein V2I56_22355 [Desulfobacteraceae bacterium]|nr:hypothetical protein [Desulfobacteraceae bacterium]
MEETAAGSVNNFNARIFGVSVNTLPTNPLKIRGANRATRGACA